MGDQKLFSQRLREIALVPKEFAEDPLDELRSGAPIIDIARCQAKGQQLTLIIDDQVQLEAIEPADRSLAASGASANTRCWRMRAG